MAKKILVVDDDRLVLNTLRKLFSKESYDVVTVQSGKEALEKIKKADFDLIVSDIKMAGIDGVETATAIKRYFNEKGKPEIPIVFITGYADIAEQKHAQNLGEVLIKPFDNKELLENIRIETEILPHRKIRRKLQVEKRFSPRIATNFPIRLLPDDIDCSVLNISETGICFDCEGPTLSGNILLSMNLSPSRYSQLTEIPAKVVWHKALSENKARFGAEFSLLDKGYLPQIRDFIFGNFAEKASEAIEDNNLKMKVQDFFNKDVRQYHEGLSTLAHEIDDGEIKAEQAEKRLTTLTNEVLLKGEALEKIVDNNIYIKKIKQVFREIVGWWCYKSPIVKMAYEKPRGYPGDYELFEIIYNNKSLSESKSIGFYCDRYFLNDTYTTAVRTRKNKMKNILQDLIENSDLSTIRMLNIACGPSREIRELFSEQLILSEISGKKIVFTGLDNDKDALGFSKSALNSLPSNVETRFLHENVLNIFRNDKCYDLIGKQDIIYILGLSEYLPERIFKRLIHFLFQLVDDKGMLVVTYKDKDITFPSLSPDWFCDWAFIKRGKEDLINAAKELGADKHSLKIEKEGTGTIFFFILTKN